MVIGNVHQTNPINHSAHYCGERSNINIKRESSIAAAFPPPSAPLVPAIADPPPDECNETSIKNNNGADMDAKNKLISFAGMLSLTKRDGQDDPVLGSNQAGLANMFTSTYSNDSSSPPTISSSSLFMRIPQSAIKDDKHNCETNTNNKVTLQETISANMSIPLHATPDTFSVIPKSILKNTIKTFSELMESRLRSAILQLMNKTALLGGGRMSKESRIMFKLLSPSRVPKRVISAVNGFIGPEINDVGVNRREEVEVKDGYQNEVASSITMTYKALVDVRFLNNSAETHTIELSCPVEILGQVNPRDRLFQYIEIKFDCEELLGDMIEQARWVAKTLLVKAASLAREIACALESADLAAGAAVAATIPVTNNSNRVQKEEQLQQQSQNHGASTDHQQPSNVTQLPSCLSLQSLGTGSISGAHSAGLPSMSSFTCSGASGRSSLSKLFSSSKSLGNKSHHQLSPSRSLSLCQRGNAAGREGALKRSLRHHSTSNANETFEAANTLLRSSAGTADDSPTANPDGWPRASSAAGVSGPIGNDLMENHKLPRSNGSVVRFQDYSTLNTTSTLAPASTCVSSSDTSFALSDSFKFKIDGAATTNENDASTSIGSNIYYSGLLKKPKSEVRATGVTSSAAAFPASTSSGAPPPEQLGSKLHDGLFSWLQGENMILTEKEMKENYKLRQEEERKIREAPMPMRFFTADVGLDAASEAMFPEKQQRQKRQHQYSSVDAKGDDCGPQRKQKRRISFQ